jgi:hypothetical protein
MKLKYVVLRQLKSLQSGSHLKWFWISYYFMA